MSKSPGTRIHVLYVDPACSNRRLELRTQEEVEFTVTTAMTLTDGRHQFDERAIDCVVSEYDLPDGTGIELLEAIRATDPALPFFLFTDSGSEAIASDALVAGVTGYLQKDRDADQLASLSTQITRAVARGRTSGRSNGTDRSRAVQRLHSTTRAVMQAETAVEVADRTVDAVRDILAMPANAVHLYDERDGGLRPIAWTESVEDLIGDVPTFYQGDSLAWQVYETGEPRIYNSHSAVTGRFNPDTVVRSEIILPLGADGVLLIGSPDSNAFDETDVSLAQTLAANVTTALARIEREQELREERSFIDQALNTLTDVFFVIGTEGEILRWNDRAREAFGYSDAELAVMDVADAFSEREYERVATAIEEALTTGAAVVEADVQTAAGDAISYEFTGARLTDTEGDLVGLVGVGRDITARKRRERELERQNERLEEFAGIVSHDLRNPLNVAQGRLGLLEAERDGEHLDSIRRAHDRMEALIDDILTVARTGETAENLVPVALADVVDSCWETVATGDATLVIDTTLTIRAETGQLKQLLENLFRNAIEHGGSTVTVTVGDMADGFYVEDDGAGIPAGEREHVFDIGYSLSPGGTGIGLRIIDQVATAHGWTVSVTDGMTGGARFEITGITTKPTAT
ncbi:PAS domain S-box protein [Halorarum halophilum]|uniref:histidine kinase n=1 Tax=Halorarum halophilum TaxID=2743090 RepID=A0A7D5GKM7_9EURY|nr:PAS domain S-box protein [Halobaculum halophilum]QLG27407.1 PAS domain S-box protein [Halobaculum halophilum]